MRIRETTAADIDAVAELRVRAWQSAYAGLLPGAYPDAMSVAEDAARRREGFAGNAAAGVENLVAQSPAGGGITGWAAIGPYRSSGPRGHDGPAATDVAELYAIYVRPGLLGRGIGGALTAACLERAAQRGFTRVVLWVLEGNIRARRFYEREGFSADGTRAVEDVDGLDPRVPVVRYARPLAGPEPPQHGDCRPPGSR